MAITVTEGGWGQVDVADIQAVLRSAYTCLAPRFASPHQHDIRVVHGSPHGNPEVLWHAGVHEIHLTVGGRYWAQYAYQFLHELCHVLTNYQRLIGLPSINNWFQEVVCDVASLYGLRRMAELWTARPPYPNWAEYTGALSGYAMARLAAPDSQIQGDLPTWLGENMGALTRNQYDRQRISRVSNRLLSEFEVRPELWRSLSYLNLGGSNAAADFRDYLSRWRDACPDSEKPSVDVLRHILLGQP